MNDHKSHCLSLGPSILIVAIACGGCDRMGINQQRDAKNGKQSDVDNTPRVETITVVPQDLARKIELPGTVEGYEMADLYAKVGGFLAEINVDIGDEVTKGQVLAELSIPEMQKQLKQKQAAVKAAEADANQSRAAIRQSESLVVEAEARLAEAKSHVVETQAVVDQQTAEFSRVQGMVSRGSLNRQLLDEATYKRDAASAAHAAMKSAIQTSEAELVSSKAGVEKARSDLDSAIAHVELAKADHETLEAMAAYGVIRAPFDGMVTKRYVDVGAFVQPADGNSSARPLLTVTRIDVVKLGLDLPMQQVRWLNRGDRVIFDRINVLPGVSIEGAVTRFASALDRNSRLMYVEIDLPNPEHQLLPGYYGYVTLLLDEMSQIAVVPSSALIASGGETFVCVIKNGVSERRPISIVYEDGSIVGVETGLTVGEQVVRSGGGQLRDGEAVIAVNAGA